MAMKDSIRIINIEGQAGIGQVQGLAEEIGNVLKETEKLVINIGRLESADLSIIQILYAARREAKKQGKEVHLNGKLSLEFRERLVRGGFCSEAPEEANELEEVLIDF